ncbi:34211_t:CDS:2, partial [Racocetra persica]
FLVFGCSLLVVSFFRRHYDFILDPSKPFVTSGGTNDELTYNAIKKKLHAVLLENW